MASENEPVEEVLHEIFEAYETWKRSEISELPTQHLKEWHDRIEAAHGREMKHQAVHNCELRAKSGLCGLKDEIKAHRREVAELTRKCEEYERQPELMAETAKAALELIKAQDAKIAELRECLKEASETTLLCDSCKTPCSEYTQDTCPIKKKWRNALEGANNEGK